MVDAGLEIQKFLVIKAREGPFAHSVGVKNMVTPKWLALLNGFMDCNLRSISWWFIFDPHPIVF